MTPTDDDGIDCEIEEMERAAEMERIADGVIAELDAEREWEQQQVEAQVERQMADAERESFRVKENE